MLDVNEVVKHIHLKDIHPFPDHPFEVKDDEYMRETLESVREYGVLSPVIVRPREEGGYIAVYRPFPEGYGALQDYDNKTAGKSGLMLLKIRSIKICAIQSKHPLSEV